MPAGSYGDVSFSGNTATKSSQLFSDSRVVGSNVGEATLAARLISAPGLIRFKSVSFNPQDDNEILIKMEKGQHTLRDAVRGASQVGHQASFACLPPTTLPFECPHSPFL